MMADPRWPPFGNHGFILVSYDMITSRYGPQLKFLGAAVRKNQTNSKFRGKGGHGKFDFFHILMIDWLGYY